MVPVASSDEVTLFASELVKLELLMSYNQPRSITLRCAHNRHPRLFVSAVPCLCISERRFAQEHGGRLNLELRGEDARAARTDRRGDRLLPAETEGEAG